MPDVVPDEPPAVTLDAGGVLLLPDPAAMREALAAFDAAPDEPTCWRAHYEMVRVLDGMVEPDYPEVSRRMAAALGVPPERCAAAGPVVSEVYLDNRWVAAPGAARALERLAARGCALAVISNSTHGRMEAWLGEVGLCGAPGGSGVPVPGIEVVAVLDSAVLGIEKPDPRIFEAALAALGVAPSGCIHVGDSVALDVRPAQAVGMCAVHVDPLGSCRATDHAHAGSLAEFVDGMPGRPS